MLACKRWGEGGGRGKGEGRVGDPERMEGGGKGRAGKVCRCLGAREGGRGRCFEGESLESRSKGVYCVSFPFSMSV